MTCVGWFCKRKNKYVEFLGKVQPTKRYTFSEKYNKRAETCPDLEQKHYNNIFRYLYSVLFYQKRDIKMEIREGLL